MSEHELWNELGNLYFLSGAYPQAVHAYRRAIRLDEEFGRPYSNLALTYVQQGKLEEAVELYRRSIELLKENKEKAISWNRLGNVYRHLRDYRQAIVAYRQADELDPDNASDDDKPGWLSEPAREELPGELTQTPNMDAILPIHPGPSIKVKRSTAPNREGRPLQLSTATWAVADPVPYQQNVSQMPEPGSLTTWGDPTVADPGIDWPSEPDTEIYFPDLDDDDLTKWLPVPDELPQDMLEPPSEDPEEEIDAEDPFLAEDQFPELSRRGPGELNQPAPEQPAPEWHEHMIPRPRSDVIVRDRRLTELLTAAAPHEQTVLFASSGEADPQPTLKRNEEEMRDIEAGLAKFKRVVEVNPTNAHAWDTLGNLYKSAGQYKDALLAYQQAISNDPKRSLYHHHLALVYAHEGRMEDAIDAMQHVIEIDPDHALAHAALGGYYRKMGLEELAQKHVGKAMKNIFDSENEYNRACLAAICGDTDQALRLLRVALQNKQTYVDWILRDPDLDFIRQDPRFKQLISDYAR
jgi:tetratricopeptide (TPR) repeat protein